MIDSRPATRKEVLARYCGDRVQFETYAREVPDSRTENGVRHIRKATALVRNVNGVPTVRRRSKDFELYAVAYTLETGRTVVTAPTIIKR